MSKLILLLLFPTVLLAEAPDAQFVCRDAGMMCQCYEAGEITLAMLPENSTLCYALDVYAERNMMAAEVARLTGQLDYYIKNRNAWKKRAIIERDRRLNQ